MGNIVLINDYLSPAMEFSNRLVEARKKTVLVTDDGYKKINQIQIAGMKMAIKKIKRIVSNRNKK